MTGRRLCAHADQDGKGMHWLEPGEPCPSRQAPRMLTRDFPLRRDLIIRMTLPVELTEEDAERLAQFVRALVMPVSAL